jgi:hypothetical protein
MNVRQRSPWRRFDPRLLAAVALAAILLTYGLYSVLNKADEPLPPEDPPISEVPEDPEDPVEPSEPTDPIEPVEPVIPDLPGALIVSIDNKVEARPHTGLEHADLVMEVLAEWRITRLIAFYYTHAVAKIGPVRSTRYYGAQLVAPYNSPFAHAGGSTDGLQMIRDLAVPDLDEINNSSAAFWRDNTRYAPHNLYTSTDLMLAQAERRRLNLTPMPELTLGEQPGGMAGERIGIVYSQRDPARYLIDYRVDWWWEEGVYHRYMNSLPHVTTDDVQITAHNVIVVLVNHRDLVAATWRTEMDLIGSGEAVFFRDGKAHIGTWTKVSAKAHFVFTVNNEPYMYAPGNTWIQIVPNTAPFEF